MKSHYGVGFKDRRDSKIRPLTLGPNMLLFIDATRPLSSPPKVTRILDRYERNTDPYLAGREGGVGGVLVLGKAKYLDFYVERAVKRDRNCCSGFMIPDIGMHPP